MTLDDLEKGIWAGIATVVAALFALVRGADVRRLDQIERRQDVADGKLAAEVHQLRKEARENHKELMELIIARTNGGREG